MRKIVLPVALVPLFVIAILLFRNHLFPQPSRLLHTSESSQVKNTSLHPLSLQTTPLKESITVHQNSQQNNKATILENKSTLQDDKLKALRHKSELTPAEMRQLELARKLERRRNGYAKSDSPDEYAKFHRLIRTKAGAKAPDYGGNYKLTELYAAQQISNASKSNSKTSNLNWSERGPANVPSS